MPRQFLGLTPYYDGPPSDHFDGERFFNPGPPRQRRRFSVWRWRLSRKRIPWSETMAATSMAAPCGRIEGGALQVWFIGHATVLVQTRGRNILTDPFFSELASPVTWIGPRRIEPPGIALESLPPIDLVLVSHSHYDHMDLPSLARLVARDRPRIIAPLGNDTIIQRRLPDADVAVLDWGQGLDLGAGLGVHLEPSHHWSRRRYYDRNRALWGAFVITTPDGPIYFAGDTGHGGGDHFRHTARRFAPFRLALLPIGAYEPRWFMAYSHMNPEGAVRAHGGLGAAHSLAIHHGTIRLSDEPREAPALELAAARTAAGLGEIDFRVLAAGEDWAVPPLAAGLQGQAAGA